MSMSDARIEDGNLQTSSEAFRIRARQLQRDIIALNALLLSVSQLLSMGREITSQPYEKALELLHQTLDLFHTFHQLLESASQIPAVSPHIYVLITLLRVNVNQASHLESMISAFLDLQY